MVNAAGAGPGYLPHAAGRIWDHPAPHPGVVGKQASAISKIRKSAKLRSNTSKQTVEDRWAKGRREILTTGGKRGGACMCVCVCGRWSFTPHTCSQLPTEGRTQTFEHVIRCAVTTASRPEQLRTCRGFVRDWAGPSLCSQATCLGPVSAPAGKR